MEYDEQTIIEKVFKNSENDYATVLAIARRARQILDDYPKYEEQLEHEKATTIALEEFVGGDFEFDAELPGAQAED
jgi:DNA-directed RNA polymerase omega subunit